MSKNTICAINAFDYKSEILFKMNHPYRILFVCLGNICRSSAAEEVMRQKLKNAGLNEIVEVDSAGLIDYHEGELSDSRMRRHAKQRGYILTHLSRPITRSDYEQFDLIIGMDDQNITRLQRGAKTESERMKIHKMTEFFVNCDSTSIPDPYYGGESGFENVLDLLEDGCTGLLRELNHQFSFD